MSREILVRGDSATDELSAAIKKLVPEGCEIDPEREVIPGGMYDDSREGFSRRLSVDIPLRRKPERPAPAPATGDASRVPDVFMYLVRQWMLDDKGRCRECEAHAEEEHREDCPLFIVYAALSSAATVTPPVSAEPCRCSPPGSGEEHCTKDCYGVALSMLTHGLRSKIDEWNDAYGDYPESKRDCADELEQLINDVEYAGAVPQAGAHTQEPCDCTYPWCEYCGTPEPAPTETRECEQCHGKGYIGQFGRMGADEPCDLCGGSGKDLSPSVLRERWHIRGCSLDTDHEGKCVVPEPTRIDAPTVTPAATHERTMYQMIVAFHADWCPTGGLCTDPACEFLDGLSTFVRETFGFDVANAAAAEAWAAQSTPKEASRDQ